MNLETLEEFTNFLSEVNRANAEKDSIYSNQ